MWIVLTEEVGIDIVFGEVSWHTYNQAGEVSWHTYNNAGEVNN